MGRVGVSTPNRETETREAMMEVFKLRASHLRLTYAAFLILVFGLAWSSPARAQTFGGQAFAAYVNVPTLGAGPLYLADAGQVPASGGVQSADLLGAEVPSVLSGEVLNSAAVGGDLDGSSSSSTSLANV